MLGSDAPSGWVIFEYDGFWSKPCSSVNSVQPAASGSSSLNGLDPSLPNYPSRLGTLLPEVLHPYCNQEVSLETC